MSENIFSHSVSQQQTKTGRKSINHFSLSVDKKQKEKERIEKVAYYIHKKIHSAAAAVCNIECR